MCRNQKLVGVGAPCTTWVLRLGGRQLPEGGREEDELLFLKAHMRIINTWSLLTLKS